MNKLTQLLSRLVTMAAAGGMASTGVAQQIGQNGFASIDEARAYLVANPTGPLAEEAFRFVVQEGLAEDFPQFPKEQLLSGRMRMAPVTPPVAPDVIRGGFDTVAQSNGDPAVGVY